MRKKSYLTVTDQFCGAGGSSQGVRNVSKRIGGVEVKLALNHWELAIETHNTNFPDTQHECTDISACDPRRYPSTDILITSPECTNHSLAKGQKAVKKQMDLFAAGKMDAAAERSRSTMWDVCRFAEFHKYNCIIVENVVDARKWVMFDAWINAMYVLGYLHKCVYLNSMHCHPTPQSRDRMYIVFWKKNNNVPMLEYTPNAFCPQCNNDIFSVQTWKKPHVKFGKYKQQYLYKCPVHGVTVEPYYYAAFNIIDWSNRGTRIGDRKKDLAPNSKKRILSGLDKFGPQPFVIHAAYGSEARGVFRKITDTAFTQTTIPSQAIINPFIITGEHSFQTGYVRSSTDTIQTQSTRQTMALVTPSFIVENKKTSKVRAIDSPLSCATTVPYHGILTTESWNSFINYNRNQSPTSIVNPIQTIATLEQNGLVSYQQPSYEDCYYRMLKANEIKLAMAFDKDYTVLGSGKDQVKQLGNAVTPPAMEWLVEQCINSLNN